MKPLAMSAVSWQPGRLDIFAIHHPDKALYHNWFNGSWRGWESLGGILMSAPVAVSRDQNHLDLFALGTDGRMYQKWWSDESWGPGTLDWNAMWDQTFISRPAAVSWDPNRIDVVGLSDEKTVQHAFWDGHTWHRWEDLGSVGTFVGQPVVASMAPGRLDVFAVTDTGTAYSLFFQENEWGPRAGWQSLGGKVRGPLTVLAKPGSLDVYGVGVVNKDVLHKRWPSQNDWTSLGGVFHSPPAVTSWPHADYGTAVFGLGTDDQMYVHSAEIGPGWLAIGGVFNSAPAAVSWGDNRWDIFGLGTDNQMYHKYYAFSAWGPPQGGWEALGGVFEVPLVGS